VADLFLGEGVDPATHQRNGQKVVLSASDFTTHGVIVGMTGSGKTGLGIVLIEECLTAGVPAILIDPKGDLGNLCLTFPALAPTDFEPWVNEGDAQKAGQTVAEYAAAQAAAWRDGLASWGYGPERIAALRSAVELTIYTPGSTAGVPVNVVGSLQAPADTSDIETMRDEIEGYVGGLLGLVGIEADPLSSPEHILLSNLIETSWMAGRSLDLPTVIGQVQNPPLRKLGVFELDQFFPPKDRMALALRLNGLLASPSFAAWAAGAPLDIGSMVRTPDGRPRAAIVTTAHLSDEERQFVTALVLAKVVTWMRKQSGTTDLRALLYMDEVAGYVPPTAMPPTKRPIMTLMKQARAFGVGVVLSTQNPVDVDYKALSNAGTWMIGRLQTERDKARLLDGMSAAAGSVDLSAVGDTISGLANREFVLRRAGKDKPELFTTRWAMSYLRGPLTRDQIASLTQPNAAAEPTGVPTAPGQQPQSLPPPVGGPQPAPPAAPDADETSVMPAVADTVAVRWVDVAAPWLGRIGASATGRRREPAVVARVHLRYDETKADLVHDEEYEAVIFPLSDRPDPSMAYVVDYDDRDLRSDPPEPCTYALTDVPLDKKTFWTTVQRDVVEALVRAKALQIHTNRDLKLYSRPGESEADFAARCAAVADDFADKDTAALRGKYEARIRKLVDSIDAARDRVEVLDQQRQGRVNEELVTGAGSILRDLFGGRSRKGVGGIFGTLGGAAGRRSRTATSSARVEAAENKVDTLEANLGELENELADELLTIEARWSAKATHITPVAVRLERTDIQVAQLVLAWVPVD
jgi:hypothetical protein